MYEKCIFRYHSIFTNINSKEVKYRFLNAVKGVFTRKVHKIKES